MATVDIVAFDIETTGFEVGDEVTVVGFALPLGCRVFMQAGERRAAGDLEATVREQTGRHVNLSVHASEAAVLRAVGNFADERFDGDDEVLVAYNGELWKSGFDLPFLRTRLAATGVEWPFRDIPYTDLLPVVTRRFNLMVDGDAQSTLPGAYETLIDGGLNELDPFAESSEAVTAFEEGRLTDLVVHNVADILRTRALGELSRQYCSKSDYQWKSLTPTIHDS